MKRFALTAAAGVLYCTGLLAAPVDEHIRGKIVSVAHDTWCGVGSFEWRVRVCRCRAGRQLSDCGIGGRGCRGIEAAFLNP